MDGLWVSASPPHDPLYRYGTPRRRVAYARVQRITRGQGGHVSCASRAAPKGCRNGTPLRLDAGMPQPARLSGGGQMTEASVRSDHDSVGGGKPIQSYHSEAVPDVARTTSRGQRLRAAVDHGGRWVTAPSGRDRAPVLVPLVVLVTCALLVLMQLYLAIPLAPVVADALGDDDAAAATALVTAYSLAYALGFLIFGPLSDRYGRKIILVPGMAALAIATAALTTAATLPAVAALRTAQGLLAASFAAVALAYVGEALPPRWRSTGIGAISTAFLVAGIAGQIYAQAVSLALGWRWVFGLAAAGFAIAAVVLATVLAEPVRTGPPASLGQKYRLLMTVAARRELALVLAAVCTVLLSFVAMYAALGPLLQGEFGLGDTDVLLVRLAGLPAMLLAPLAGWLAGRFGFIRVTVAGFLVAAIGLAAEAATVNVLWALVIASVIFVAGIATVVPAVIALAGSLGGSARAGALGLTGLAAFVGASCAPLVAQLPLGFSGRMLVLVALLVTGAGLVVFSGRAADVRTARKP
jgi:MFS transporter, YNFM family, putative membrane transport protein